MLKEHLKISDEEIDFYLTQFYQKFGKRKKGYRFNNLEMPYKPVMLATAARSGGMYLADLLQQNNFNEIDEFLNPFGDGIISTNWDESIHKIALAANENGNNFGIKCSIYDLIPFIFKLQFPIEFEKLNWVYLTRDSIVDQAISLVLAEQTRVWSLHDYDYKEKFVPPQPDEISPQIVLDRIAVIAEDMRRWEIFFAMHGINPVRISYNELTKFPEEVVRHICNTCGMPENRIETKKTSILVQRTDANALVHQAYRKYISSLRQDIA